MIKFTLLLHGIRDTMMTKNDPHPLEAHSQSTRGDTAKASATHGEMDCNEACSKEENKNGHLLAKI